jgi:two-component system LytT family response regulator
MAQAPAPDDKGRPRRPGQHRALRQFYRVHRSTIVWLDMIAELSWLTNRDALLRLREGSALRASRFYMPALAEALHPLGKTPSW